MSPIRLSTASLYACVSSDRQNVDLPVSAHLRAIKDYARAKSYAVAREGVATPRAAESPTGPGSGR